VGLPTTIAMTTMLCITNESTLAKKSKMWCTIDVVRWIAPCKTDRIALIICKRAEGAAGSGQPTCGAEGAESATVGLASGSR